MHTFRYVNRTRIHDIMRTNMNGWEFKVAYITPLHYGTTCVKICEYRIFVWYSSLKVCCMRFWIFLVVAEGSVFVSLPLWHDCCEQTEEWKLHSARKCLSRNWSIRCGKMNQVLRLVCFFKMQKLIGCGTTTRKCWLLMDSFPIPRTRAHVHMKMAISLFHLHFLA